MKAAQERSGRKKYRSSSAVTLHDFFDSDDRSECAVSIEMGLSNWGDGADFEGTKRIVRFGTGLLAGWLGPGLSRWERKGLARVSTENA